MRRAWRLLPRDYDFQSTLLRVGAQSGAVQIALPAGPPRAGHGVEHGAARLRALSEATLSALVCADAPLVDRVVIAPPARALLPWLLRRQIGTAVPVLAAMAMLALALLLAGFGMAAAGLPMLALAQVALACGTALAMMRDEEGLARLQGWLAGAGLAAMLVLIGLREWQAEAALAALVAAGATALIASFATRAAPQPPRWQPSPAAYALLLLPFAAAGQVFAGLIAAGGYAALALGVGIERLRKNA